MHTDVQKHSDSVIDTVAVGVPGSLVGETTMARSFFFFPRLPTSPLGARRDLGAWWADEQRSGLLVAAAVVAAVVWASSPWGAAYHAVWDHPLPDGGVGPGPMTVRAWINDGAMTAFFLVVGVELGRERAAGVLSSWRRAAVPSLAALGGMAAAAGTYLLIVHGGPGTAGWGVPMATDIALVAAAAGALGGRVPLRLRTFLVAVAVADDVASIIVLAATDHHPVRPVDLVGALVAATLAVGVLAWGHRQWRSLWPVLGCLGLLWLALAHLGVEPALSGAVTGLLAPRRAAGPGRRAPAAALAAAAHPWSAAVVVPLFALANVGVALRPSVLSAPGALAVFLGVVTARVVGKAVGIAGATRLGSVLAGGHGDIGGRLLVGGSALCGMGFTVPLLFVATTLASFPSLAAAARAGLLVGSLGALGLSTAALALPGSGRAGGGRPRGAGRTSGARAPG